MILLQSRCFYIYIWLNLNILVVMCYTASFVNCYACQMLISGRSLFNNLEFINLHSLAWVGD